MKNTTAVQLDPDARLMDETKAAPRTSNFEPDLGQFFIRTKIRIAQASAFIRGLGVVAGMDEYEKRKLAVFNQLNFLQLLTGLILPIAVFATDSALDSGAVFKTLLPCLVSLLVLTLNYHCRREAALFAYFLLYPVATSVVYLGGMNLGIELFFILYGILSVFFIQDIGQMLFAVTLSMISYFVLTVLWKNYHYNLEDRHVWFYLFNQLLAVLFIFYGLYLVKRENGEYQFRLITKSRLLHRKSLEIGKQKKDIEIKAAMLEKQTRQLQQSDLVKNTLFSVIAHDLKTPMYALRNLFRNLQEQELTPEEVKGIVPDVASDLQNATDLLENLLHWAKNQMQNNAVRPQLFDVTRLAAEVMGLFRLQARAKNITVTSLIAEPALIYADRDMIHLVLRNLLANAIKFTPANGHISIGSNEMAGYLEVYVRDSGVGMSRDAMQRIRQNDCYTTRGTNNEAGTGLGLMLAREFVMKNGGHICIESEVGKGTTISFTVPRGEELSEAV
ncbi:MAG TPA: HAMP domain-containing sensor histidine kinase [Chitinophagaceae bacterium]|nr:HAMP domain-containing sensor histidine kinase [Chitinophagaceae bacterium]